MDAAEGGQIHPLAAGLLWLLVDGSQFSSREQGRRQIFASAHSCWNSVQRILTIEDTLNCRDRRCSASVTRSRASPVNARRDGGDDRGRRARVSLRLGESHRSGRSARPRLCDALGSAGSSVLARYTATPRSRFTSACLRPGHSCKIVQCHGHRRRLRAVRRAGAAPGQARDFHFEVVKSTEFSGS